MSKRGTTPEEPYFRSLIDGIAEFGHYIISVSDAVDQPTDEPPFAYSIGAFESYAAPEIIVSGLSANLMSSMINEFMERWKTGEHMAAGVPLSGFLGGHDVMCIDVSSDYARTKYALSIDWYYEGEHVPIWQMVWPGAKSGKFPWDDPEVAALQDCTTGASWSDVRHTLG